MSEHVVLVTGALTGIGRATATAFGRDGASVVVSGRHDEEGEALAAELRTLGGKAEYLRADVSIEDDVRSLIDATVETFGQLDAAVNNAAHTNQFGRLVTQTAEAYDATFNTNVRGLLFCLKHELRVMIERGQGSIVNLSSTYGERGVAGAGLYAASKHAVNGLTRWAALEVATTGVRVNAVAPGPIATGALARFTGPDSRASSAASVPMGRLGEVDEIADVITFLSSHAARFITGQIIAVNGGKRAL
jgi:NAD(P)-dependent dehydrogenase (short-subunit alcohol dehydrogenase family)